MFLGNDAILKCYATTLDLRSTVKIENWLIIAIFILLHFQNLKSNVFQYDCLRSRTHGHHLVLFLTLYQSFDLAIPKVPATSLSGLFRIFNLFHFLLHFF